MFILTTTTVDGGRKIIRSEQVDAFFSEDGHVWASFPDHDEIIGQYSDTDIADAELLRLLQAIASRVRRKFVLREGFLGGDASC